VPAAKKFYTKLLGWKTQPFGKGAVGYTLFKQGRDNAGGMMKCPKPGNPAQWIPYVYVDDVDATVKKQPSSAAKSPCRRSPCRQRDTSPFWLIHKARHSESSSLRRKGGPEFYRRDAKAQPPITSDASNRALHLS
jgi:hypothetical protein